MMVDPQLDGVVALPVLAWACMMVVIPDDATRIATHGLRLSERSDSRKLLMHALVHADWKHFAQNALVYATFAAALRPPPRLAQRGLSRAALTAALLTGGAIVGVWACAVDADRRTEAFKDTWGLGIGFVRSIAGAVHSSVTNARCFVGGSAAISAVMGYVTCTSDTLPGVLPGLVAIGSDVAALLDHEPPLFALSAGQVGIAHAAHVGGFLFGAAVGLGLRLIDRSLTVNARFRNGNGRVLGGN